MPPREHLQIINPSYPRGDDVLFERFPRLPAEIRLLVWGYAVVQHRLLEVELEPPLDSPPQSPPRRSKEARSGRPGKAPLYSTTNALGKVISGGNYVVAVDGSVLYSKLLRVNSESRRAALRFYRVHIPCYFLDKDPGYTPYKREGGRILERRGERAVKATLYFNPEHDFLHLQTSRARGEHSLVDFLHDLKAYDPQDVGLLNLALNTNGVMGLRHGLDKISEAPARVAFVDTLSQLREIIWIAHSRAGRWIVPYQGFEGVGVQFNHSLPVKAVTPRFDLLERDPRPIGPELKFVLTACSDPRQMRVGWRQILERWNIHQAEPARERVLFAFEGRQIDDVETAHQFLEHEEDSWVATQHDTSWYIHSLVKAFTKNGPPIETPEELAKAVRPAIGFWLFPAEALGSLEGDISGAKKVFDLSGHWPELALARLS